AEQVETGVDQLVATDGDPLGGADAAVAADWTLAVCGRHASRRLSVADPDRQTGLQRDPHSVAGELPALPTLRMTLTIRIRRYTVLSADPRPQISKSAMLAHQAPREDP